MKRGWPTPSPMVRVGLLVASGVLLTAAALWAGSVGPWTARPLGVSTPPPIPTFTDFPTLPTLPTFPRLSAPAGGSSWDPTAVLVVLGVVLLIALLLIAASMIRNRGSGAVARRRAAPAQDALERAVPVPDPDRPFDTREAADFVIACWEQLEQRAALRGTARRREQTPTEFVETLRTVYPTMDGRAAAELLGLYQRARFDHVRLLPDTAVRARVCADVVTSALTSAWTVT